MKIIVRDIPPRTAWTLEQAGIHPLLAQLYAARGVQGTQELDDSLARLIPPANMLGLSRSAVLLADAIHSEQKPVHRGRLRLRWRHRLRLWPFAACACWVRSRCIIVPDRVVDGYGLTSPNFTARQRQRC
jgi:single-stranded-DNA-specific exonuclease